MITAHNGLPRSPIPLSLLRHGLRTPLRTLATIADPQPQSTRSHAPLTVEPFLLEDISEGKTPEEIKRIPQFTISRKSGFLPRQDPLVDLPADFRGLDSLLKRMTIKQYDHATQKETGPGLLALGQFGDAVKHELRVGGVEDQAVDRAIASGDQHFLSALFRDYCFA